MPQAIRSFQHGCSVGYIGVPHRVEMSGEERVLAHVHLHGGPAPVRQFLPDLVWHGTTHSGQVSNLTLPLDEVAEGYRAMNDREAIKVMVEL